MTSGGPFPQAGPVWPPMAYTHPPRTSGASGWRTGAIAMMLLVTVGAALAAWLHPVSSATSAVPGTSTYSEAEIAEAKDNVCAAMKRVIEAFRTSDGYEEEHPDREFIFPVRQRQLLLAADEYLTVRLEGNDAVPPELKQLVQRISDSYLVMMMNGLGGAPNSPAAISAVATGEEVKDYCGFRQ